MGTTMSAMQFGGIPTRPSHNRVSVAPNNMHSRLPGTWRRFNVPETVPGACSVAAYPDRERCIGSHKRTTPARAEIDVGLRTTVLSTKSQAHPCHMPGAPLPAWYLSENEPVARRSDPLTDLLSAGAYKAHVLSKGAGAPNYGEGEQKEEKQKEEKKEGEQKEEKKEGEEKKKKKEGQEKEEKKMEEKKEEQKEDKKEGEQKEEQKEGQEKEEKKANKKKTEKPKKRRKKPAKKEE